MLYVDAKSVICINGKLSKPFDIKRSVRQGCPLSMILFIIAQEPLYRMLKYRLMNYSPRLPNNMKICVMGYADDSSVVLNSDVGIRDSFKVLHEYEIATGARLNFEKTSIFGLGKWKDRNIWPMSNLKVETKSCRVLGISYSNEYEESVKLNWGKVGDNVANSVGVLSNRKLTLFQRAIILNSKVLSKCWYIAHVFPMPKEIEKQLAKCTFKYLWNGNYQPINRQTLYLPKWRGGCGIVNIHCKSKAILFNTFYKNYVNESYGLKLLMYFCQIRASYLLSENRMEEATIMPTPYYMEAIDILRRVIKMETFPTVRSSNIYKYLLKQNDAKANVESNYPLFNWKNIWKYINSKFVEPYDREILYKYVHEVLVTKDKLNMMNITDDKLCVNCGEEENLMHLFYFCQLGKNVRLWMVNLMKTICKLKTNNMLRIFKLDFVAGSSKDRNTVIILLTDFIVGMWQGYKLGFLLDDPYLITFIKEKMLRTRWMLNKMYKLDKNFTDGYIKMFYNY